MDDAEAPEVPGYDVGRLLGRGGSADVWLAREERTGGFVALKCFRAPGGRAQDSSGRFGAAITEEEMRREIRILSVLDHQHLIKAHDAVGVGDPGSGTALTMEYAAGGSLAQLVAVRGRLSVGETITVLTPIAQALGYLHGRGFTHSDVSPGNVLFTGQGKPMLSDVGVARMLGDPGSPDSAGTPGFLDPTPVDAVRAGLQPERDVYAAAALGWFCLTGVAPGRTADRPPLSLLVPDVPKDLAAVLEAGLNEDRRLRPNALALATAVYRSAEPQPVDLSDAVHPTVLPELLTRRHVVPEPRGAGFRTRLQAWRRRLATSRWHGASPNQSPPARLAAAGPGGKHADRTVVLRRRVLLRAVLPIVAAAAGGMWWLSAAGQPPWPGTAATGSLPATAGPIEEIEDGGTSAAALIVDARQQAQAADPAVAVQGLSTLRDYAFSSGRFDLLADVNAPGSAAAAADERIAAELRPSGHRLAGFTSTLSGVAAEEGATEARAVVQVTAATSAYSTMNTENNVLAAGAPSDPRQLRLLLVSVDGQWRVSDILPGTTLESSASAMEPAR